MTGLITVLGAGGAFVALEEGLDVGSAIGLRFALPGTLNEVTCCGVVRDIVPGDGVGVEFTDIGPSDRELVDISVRRAELWNH